GLGPFPTCQTAEGGGTPPPSRGEFLWITRISLYKLPADGNLPCRPWKAVVQAAGVWGGMRDGAGRAGGGQGEGKKRGGETPSRLLLHLLSEEACCGLDQLHFQVTHLRVLQAGQNHRTDGVALRD